MGLSDRQYVRGSERGLGGVGPSLGSFRGWSCTTWLIVINVAVFAVGAFAPRLPLTEIGHFSTFMAVQRLEVWRFLTFQFLHANVMHIFFNMFGLFLFGQMVESRLGGKRYLAFYLVCGIFGALMYLALNLLGVGLKMNLPGVLTSDLKTPLVGASAGVFGVLMAAAYYHPNAPMQLLLLPVTIRLQTLVYFYVGLALFNLLVGGQNAGGDAAHIGGALAGWFFIRRPHLLHDFFDVLGRSPPDAPVKTARWPMRGSRGAAARGGQAPAGPDEREVDRLLAKVATSGLHSLSEREKETLRRATEARQGQAR